VGGVGPILWLCWRGVRYRVAAVTEREPRQVLFTEGPDAEGAS